MRSRFIQLPLAILLLSVTQMSAAQVRQVIGCEVENPADFVQTLDRVWQTMSGGFRPTVALVDSTLNGANTQTHALVLDFPDYQSYEAWTPRIGETPAAQLILEQGSDNAECNTQMLLLERASWGEQDADWAWSAIFPVTTTDASTYSSALDDMMTSPTGQSMEGETTLFEVRAGLPDTHIVAIRSPGFAVLNDNLDTLFASDDFADFNGTVAGIRTLGMLSQGRHVQTWEP